MSTPPPKKLLHQYWFWVMLVMALGIILRIHWLSEKDDLFKYYWSDEYRYYTSMAVNAFDGKGFFPAYNELEGEIFVPPPLQSFLLWSLFKLAGHVVHPNILFSLQILSAALMIVLVAQIGKKLSNPLGGVLAASFAAIYPGFVFWVAFLLTENNYLVALSLFLFCLFGWAKNPNWKWGIGCSITLGLINLLRGNGLLLPLFLAGFSIFWLKDRQRWTQAALFLIVPYLIMSPWLIRNLKVYGEPIWSSSNGGINLHLVNRLGFDPIQTPFSQPSLFPDTEGRLSPDIERKVRDERNKLTITYYAYSKIYQKEVQKYILHHPVHFAKNYLIKFYNQFATHSDITKVSVAFFRKGPFYKILHVLLLLGGWLGFMYLWKKHRTPGLYIITLVFAYYCLFGALMHLTFDGRMNLYLKLFLILFMGAGLGKIILEKNQPTRSRTKTQTASTKSHQPIFLPSSQDRG